MNMIIFFSIEREHYTTNLAIPQPEKTNFRQLRNPNTARFGQFRNCGFAAREHPMRATFRKPMPFLRLGKG